MMASNYCAFSGLAFGGSSMPRGEIAQSHLGGDAALGRGRHSVREF